MKHPKRERDSNQKAFQIAQIATGEAEDSEPEPGREGFAKRATAGGGKGGKARADKLTPEQRSEIAKKAAAKRWAK